MSPKLKLKDGRIINSHTRMLHTSFIVLSLTGFLLLWGPMLSNGTLDAMNEIKKAGVFPDGRQLRSSYTGISVLDSPLTILGIFFDSGTNGFNPGPRLLLIDLGFTLQSAALWVLIENSRQGDRPLVLKMPSLWGLLWNGSGAAIILPIYYLIHLQSPSAYRAPALPLNQAKALLLTTALGFFLPLLLFLPALLGYGTERQQGFVALFQASPLIFGFIQGVVARLIAARHRSVEVMDSDQPFVVGAYILAGLSSAAAHLYVLMISLFTHDTAIMFRRVYLPSFVTIDPRAPGKIIEGTHLFLQLDWVIISLASMLYAYLLLEPRLDIIARHLKVSSSLNHVAITLLIVMTTVMLGPGATVSFACAAREAVLRKSSLARKTR